MARDSVNGLLWTAYSRYAAAMRWESTALTNRGQRRARNEDAFLCRPDKRLFAVADGMGGHPAGDVASRAAVEVIDASLEGPPGEGLDAEELGRRLVEVIEGANREICARGVVDAANRMMGTTLVVLIALDDACVIAHIGDSRAYRIRNGDTRQLTTDHTWVQEQIDRGLLAPARAKTHPRSNELARVLGMPDAGAADVVAAEARPGDVFLLCSDGLTGMVNDAEIEAILKQAKPVDALAHELVDAANRRGGADNITVVVLRACS